jgi:hypothetical protein
VTKRHYIDATTDPQCLLLLADIKRVYEQCQALSERFDAEYVAIGKCWGIKQALKTALDTAEGEFGRDADDRDYWIANRSEQDTEKGGAS